MTSFPTLMEANLKSHFLKDPPAECKDLSAYDRFVEFLYEGGTAQEMQQFLRGGSSALGGAHTGRQLMRKVVENVFGERQDVEGHSLTYMRKCVMRLIECLCVANLEVAATGNGVDADDDDGESGDEESDDETKGWEEYLHLLLRFVPRGETLDHGGDDSHRMGLENVLQIQAMRSLAALMVNVSSHSDQSSGRHAAAALRKSVDAMVTRQTETGHLFLDIVFHHVIGVIDNGYVREAAGELLASYWLYRNSESTSSTGTDCTLLESVEECFMQRFESHPLQLLELILTLIGRAASQDATAMQLRKLLLQLSVVDKYVLSDRILLVETDKSIMRKANEIVVRLSASEDALSVCPSLPQRLSGIFHEILRSDELSDHRLEVMLDMLGCCNLRILSMCLSSDSSLLSGILSRICKLLEDCTHGSQEHLSVADAGQSKLVLSAIQALTNCRRMFQHLLTSDQVLLERLITVILTCIRGFEWFHNSSNNRRICVSGLELLEHIFDEQHKLIDMLPHEMKTKVCGQLQDMCAYEASINHSMIVLKASMLLAKFLLTKPSISTLQQSVEKYFVSILGGLLDMNWEVRDSMLQLIDFICQKEIMYEWSPANGDQRTRHTDLLSQLYPRKPGDEKKKPAGSSQRASMCHHLLLVHENNNTEQARDLLERIVHLVLQRLKDVDNYVKLTTIRTLDSLMVSGLLTISESENKSVGLTCSASLTNIFTSILTRDEYGMMADYYVRRALFSQFDKWLQRAESYEFASIVNMLSEHISTIVNDCEFEMYRSVLELGQMLLTMNNSRPTDCSNMLMSLRLDDLICEVAETKMNFSPETFQSMNTLSQWIMDNHSLFKETSDSATRFNRIATVKQMVSQRENGLASYDGSMTSFFTFESDNLDCY